MATIAQIEAARRNGSLSRGPVTPEGKERSVCNAARHGMYSSTVVLNSELPEVFERFSEQVFADYTPETDRERRLVFQIVEGLWRLNRVVCMETAALDYEIDRQRAGLSAKHKSLDEGTRAALAFSHLADNGHALAMFGRYEARQRRVIERAEAQLNLLQTLRLRKKREIEPKAA
jgi:hypothetical protein